LKGFVGCGVLFLALSARATVENIAGVLGIRSTGVREREGAEMTGTKGFEGSLLVILALIAFYGCAGKQGASDYKQMVALQQQKASATKAEEPPLPPGLAATAETHEQLGDTYLRQGNAVAAFTEYERSLRKDPQRMTARYKIGMLYLGRGLSEEALKEFEQILAKEPHNAFAHYGRAKVHFLQGKPELAKGDVRDALKLDERLWQAHTLLGVVCDTEGHYAEAEGAYLKALAIQPNSAAVYNDLGVSRYLTGRFSEAAEAFLKAFNIDPENHRICNNLGLALYRLGKTENALVAFTRAGSEAAAYNNIGFLQMKDKQYKNALVGIEKAIDANPSYYARAQKNLDKVKAALKEAGKDSGEEQVMRDE
jgi:Tfp pilus assembly protein PilF